MFNVTVLKMKDITKLLVGVVLAIFIIIVLAKVVSRNKYPKEKIVNSVKKEISTVSQKSLINCLDQTLPVIANSIEEKDDNKQKEKNKNASNVLEGILGTQISIIKEIENFQEKDSKENEIGDVQKEEEKKLENENNPKTEETEEVEMANIGLKTEIITQNPIQENFNVQYKNVKIKNQTNYQLTPEILEPNIIIENKNILLFHTHSCESYTSSEKYPYTSTGNFRTTDLNYTVTRVGGELEKQLKQYNYNVIHNMDYHDYPAYNGSYTRSLATVENLLKEIPSDIIIDVHRDAIGSRSDYAPCVKIGDTDIAAQIMFVIGTNDGGLWHPNWNNNLKFAIKVQQKAEEMYPGLFKPIMLTKSRYNQHTGKYASIIEVGATGNTLEQCLTSMKYLAKVMSEVIENN